MNAGTLELEIEVHDAVSAALASPRAGSFAERVELEVAEYLRRLGLSSTPRVRVAIGGQSAMLLRIADVTMPYPASFPARLWFGIAPPELRDAAEGTSYDGARGGWLIALCERFIECGEEAGLGAVADLVAELVREVIALRPSAVLTPDEAVRFRGVDGGDPVFGTSDALFLLRALLDLGVALTEPERIRRIMEDACAASRTISDTMEEVFAALRAPCLEVQISPTAYADLSAERVPEERLAAADPRIRSEVDEVIKLVYDYRLQELGLRLPLEFVRIDRFTRPQIRVRLNDRLSPSIPIPDAGEVATTARPARLRAWDIKARPLLDPVTGHEAAAVPEEAVATLEEHGVSPIPRIGYIAAAFARAVTPNAYRVISVDDVEQDLADMEAELPVLVHAALSRFRLGEITQVLRALVREQVSIRDLSRILDILLAFADATEDDLAEMFIDDPLPNVGDPLTPVWTAWVPPRLLAFVRVRLRDRVCYDAGIDLGSSSQVHETDEEFEELVYTLLRADAIETELRLTRIRAAVWSSFAGSDASRPVILTSTRCRLLLRRAIELEIPAAHVLARAEIPATAHLRRGAPVTAPSEPP